MANPLEMLPRHLAENILNLRKARSISQSKLAELASIPRSTLTQFESGQGNPSLMNLAKISGALQVSIEELLTPRHHTVQLIKASEMPVVRRSQGAALLYKLLPDPIPGMEMDRMEINPGVRFGGVPHVSGTKEYLTCLQGEVSVHVAGKSFQVKQGDVLAFQGDQAHSYFNSGTKKSVCISIVVLAPNGM
jgi:XRE family transcriptional regulator, regulator of sulfur utilization